MGFVPRPSISRRLPGQPLVEVRPFAEDPNLEAVLRARFPEGAELLTPHFWRFNDQHDDKDPYVGAGVVRTIIRRVARDDPNLRGIGTEIAHANYRDEAGLAQYCGVLCLAAVGDWTDRDMRAATTTLVTTTNHDLYHGRLEFQLPLPDYRDN